MSVTAQPDQALISELRDRCAAAADPTLAPAQQAYMKSAMPYYGIRMPELRKICRASFRQYHLEPDDWETTALALWRNAKHREERYAALELIGHRPWRSYFQPPLLTTLEEFVVTGAWWDYVDSVAVNFVGHLLERFPDEIRPMLRNWSQDGNIWRRRTAILAQLKFKDRTDQTLLYELMAPSLEEKEFFLRKAIGWALREYSKTDPDAVIDYVFANRTKLSGLSRRESLKILLKKGKITSDDGRLA